MEVQYSNILKIHKLSKTQYDAEAQDGSLDTTALYLVPECGITFNNSGSGATSGTAFDGTYARTISYNTVGAAASSHTHGNITNSGALGTASRVVITDSNKNITVSSVITTTELGYLDGATSNIQTQLNGKAPNSHGHGNLTMPADTRDVATTCRDYNNIFSFVGLKTASAIGLPSAVGTYSYLVGLCGWSDASGGETHELAFTNNGIYCRKGGSSWGAWSSLATKDLSGNIAATSFTASSDKRLKENLSLYSCNKSILDLPIYKFTFINDETKRKHLGCLAQDLQKICPEIVHTKEGGYLAIEESKIVYLLLQELKKQNKRINDLEVILGEK